MPAPLLVGGLRGTEGRRVGSEAEGKRMVGKVNEKRVAPAIGDCGSGSGGGK